MDTRRANDSFFFNMHLSPLVPAPSGNHFGFLEPLLTCQFKLEVNSIKEITSQVSATKETLEVRKGGKQSTLDCWKKTKATNEEIAWGWIENNQINIGCLLRHFLHMPGFANLF